MNKSIHEERYSVLKKALIHEFGEHNINSSAMEKDNNIEFLINWNYNTISLMIGPVLENQDEYVVVSNVYGEVGMKVNIAIDGIDGIVSYDNLCNHIITKIRRKTMENNRRRDTRFDMPILLDQESKDLAYAEILPFVERCGNTVSRDKLEEFVMTVAAKLRDRFDIIDPRFTERLCKSLVLALLDDHIISESIEGEYIVHHSKECQYYDFGVSYEPLILEPEDWTPAQWETICKLFGMFNAERIKVSGYSLEAFGMPMPEVPIEEIENESDSSDEIRRQIIVKVKDSETELAIGTKIHNQLKGNPDYVDSRICLNLSKDRNDGTENEVHLYVFDDSESDPEIKI